MVILSPWRAGFAYFASIFAVGFVLGTIRVLVVAPRIGELVAVAGEIPIMLVTSWFLSRMLVRRLSNPTEINARIMMALTAFALLQGAETSLGVWGFGRSLPEQWAALSTAQGALGIAAQIIAATFPLMAPSTRT